MEHRFQYGGSSRGRAYRAGSFAARKAIAASDLGFGGRDLYALHRAHHQGIGQFRKQMNAPKIASDSTCGNGLPIEENSFALAFKQSSSEKASVISTSIGKEMPKGAESRRSSPSVIAKLMGLDELLPPEVGHKQTKDVGSHFRKPLSARLQEKCVSHEDLSHRMCASEDQEFKDVFEIIETSNGEKHRNQPDWNGGPYLEKIETDTSIIKQKLVDLKRFSNDETHQKSKEFNDTLDVADSEKDHFHKFHQEPSCFLTKHLHDLKYPSSSSRPIQSMISKSPKDSKYGSGELYSKSEKNAEKCTILRRDVSGTFRDATTSLFGHSLQDHSSSCLYDFPRFEKAGKVDMCFDPAQIVVLKPSLHKNQNMAGTIPLPSYRDTSELGYRRQRDFWSSGIQELYAEGRGQKLCTNVEVLGRKTKGSREIAREITRQMRNPLDRTRNEFASRSNGNTGDEILCRTANLNKNGPFKQTCYIFDDWNSSYTPSSSYSNESLVAREARRRLSERWKITHNFQGLGSVSKSSSTLGEMLAFSDRKTLKKTMHLSLAQNTPDEKLVIDGELEPEGYLLEINNIDDGKAACYMNLPGSVSHPVSSTSFRGPRSGSKHRGGDAYHSYMLKDVINLEPDHSLDGKFNQKRSSLLKSVKYCSSKTQPLKSGGEENYIPLREICVNPEDERYKIRESNLAEEKPILPVSAGSTVADTGLCQNFLCSEDRNAMVSPLTNQKQVDHPTKIIIVSVTDGKSSAIDQNDVTLEEKSYDHPQADSLSSHSDGIESESSVSSKEVEQPSPISVLDPPLEEDKSSPKHFGSVGNDLQEPWMQLELLKLEADDGHSEELAEDAGEESQTLLRMEEIFGAFRDEEDRDFSYLLDMLIDSGIRGAYEDRLLDAGCSPEYPVGSGVFEKLEKKYGALETWSRLERKLLFDLINSSLSEILAPCVNVEPWLGLKRKLMPKCAGEGLVEELWQMVARQRNELNIDNPHNNALELSWLDLGDDVNNIGREMEAMLVEDILEELVSEVIMG